MLGDVLDIYTESLQFTLEKFLALYLQADNFKELGKLLTEFELQILNILRFAYQIVPELVHFLVSYQGYFDIWKIHFH